MELAIHQNLDSPFVEVIDTNLSRIHIPLGMSAGQLAEHFGEQLEEHQLQAAAMLLSDDATDRHFEERPEFLLVRFAD